MAKYDEVLNRIADALERIADVQEYLADEDFDEELDEGDDFDLDDGWTDEGDDLEAFLREWLARHA